MNRLALLGLLLAAAPGRAQDLREPTPEGTRPLVASVPMRNPSFLRASQLLGRREPGEAPRVRFQWERIPGAIGYLLKGNWATDRAWAIRSAEYRVTSETATEWGGSTVTFEVSLPGGEHAWSVVAIGSEPSATDFGTAARLSFRLE